MSISPVITSLADESDNSKSKDKTKTDNSKTLTNSCLTNLIESQHRTSEEDSDSTLLIEHDSKNHESSDLKLAANKLRLFKEYDFSASLEEAEYERQLTSKGLKLIRVAGDGNCLFRAVADLVYGDQECHNIVRQACMNYIEVKQQFFSSYVSGSFYEYLEQKRRLGVYGDHLEIQAMAELYNRSVEIYCPGSETLKLYQNLDSPNCAPLRLSYHNRDHYNSIRDLNDYSSTLNYESANKELENTSETTELPDNVDRMILNHVCSESQKELLDGIIRESVNEEVEGEMLDQIIKQTEREEDEKLMIEALLNTQILS